MVRYRMVVEGRGEELPAKTVYDVDLFVSQTIRRKCGAVFVGDKDGDMLVPYEEWRSAQTQPRLMAPFIMGIT